MAEVIKFPGEIRRQTVLTGREIWDAGEPTDFMVWEICPYLRTHDPCHGCAREVECDYALNEDGAPAMVKYGCRALAEEACRVVFAAQKREEQK